MVEWVLKIRMVQWLAGVFQTKERKKERKKLWSIVRLNWTELIVSSPPGHEQRGGASPPDHGRAAAATLCVFFRALAVAYTILRHWWDPTPDLWVTSTHHPFVYTCVCVFLHVQSPLRECRLIRSGASGLPYYCAPLVCISVVIELLAVWRHNKPKTKNQL